MAEAVAAGVVVTIADILEDREEAEVAADATHAVRSGTRLKAAIFVNA